jgi:hypothetical protein
MNAREGLTPVERVAEGLCQTVSGIDSDGPAVHKRGLHCPRQRRSSGERTPSNPLRMGRNQMAIHESYATPCSLMFPVLSGGFNGSEV